ncbi:MAG TPA: Mur ligase domain-containing protein, partial [Gemmatimonadaceae bacterium]
MALLDTSDPRPVHFVGIAGAGMSALAELFLRRGVPITGCDANPSGAADLERLGVVVTAHDPKHVDGARALVVTSAMPKDHPELVRAREIGVPVIRRAEALGEVTVGRELV